MVRDCQATAAAWFHTSSSGVIYGRDIKARNDPVESSSVNLADVWARHQGKKWPHVIRLHQARRRRRGRVHVHAPIRLCSVADLWGRSSNKSAWLVNKPALTSFLIPHDFDHLHHMCIMKFSWLMHWPVRRLIQTELKYLLEDHVYTYHPSITHVDWFKVFTPFWILLKSFFSLFAACVWF